MTVTNEPGYYEDGKYGIRIENVLFVKEAKTPNNFGDKGFLGFENVTMCVTPDSFAFRGGLINVERTLGARSTQTSWTPRS